MWSVLYHVFYFFIIYMSNGSLLPRGRRYLVKVLHEVCEFWLCGMPFIYDRDQISYLPLNLSFL